jgi:hypothetical protein
MARKRLLVIDQVPAMRAQDIRHGRYISIKLYYFHEIKHPPAVLFIKGRLKLSLNYPALLSCPCHSSVPTQVARFYRPRHISAAQKSASYSGKDSCLNIPLAAWSLTATGATVDFIVSRALIRGFNMPPVDMRAHQAQRKADIRRFEKAGLC